MTARSRPAPRTTTGIPHLQLDQPAPASLQAELWARMTRLDGVRVGSSAIGPLSSRAIELPSRIGRATGVGPVIRMRSGPDADEAFLNGREFAHLHGDGSGSLHLTLPEHTAEQAIADGWAIRHPLAGRSFLPRTTMMVFGPRDPEELGQVWNLVQHSYSFARGSDR